MATKQKVKRNILPFQGDDELFARMQAVGREYEQCKREAERYEGRKNVAKEHLEGMVTVLVASQGLVLESLDGVTVGPTGPDGKRPVFQHVRQERKSVSAQKLLEAGVPAAIIDICTERTKVDYWNLVQLKDDE